MATKPSVTTRQARDVTKCPRWNQKLGQEGVAFLEAYRAASRSHGIFPARIDQLHEWLVKFTDAANRFPTDPSAFETRAVALDKQFVELFEGSQFSPLAAVTEGDNELAPGLAVILEVAHECTRIFERNPQTRLMAYIAVGLLYRLARPLWDRTRLEQFGKDPLDQKKASLLAAMLLEFTAKLLRGYWKPPKGKGRRNYEQVELVNAIQRYSAAPLTPKEILAALQHAGVTVCDPDLEAFRVWLHRARKQKLVEPQETVTQQIEIPVNPDGSFNLSSLDLRSRMVLRRALRADEAEAPRRPGLARAEPREVHRRFSNAGAEAHREV